MIEPFVGRVHELSTLDATYCTPGRHRVFLVEGPAGIGKSRLLAESVRHARAAGLRAITVAATEYERSTPRQVLLDLADQLDHDVDGYRYGDGDGSGSGSGSGSGDGNARMVDPGGRTLDHGIATADTRESARWLRHRLAGTPTVLIIDDAHWADPASLQVLALLIRQSQTPATVVLAYRTGQFPAELGAALRTPRADVTHLSVPPLSTDEATALLPDLTPAHRARLVAAAHGNPLYLQVLAELTPAELDQALRDDPVDTGFGHAALDRTLRAELAHLPPREQLVAQAAAVCGATADTELLSATAEVTRTDLDAAVDDLARRGWLTVTGGTVAFRHPLMRTAAYRLAGPAWRAAAHDRAARFLRTVDAPVLVRARHLEHAFGSRDDLAATELIRAAEQALATAPATSARWIEAAIRLTPDCPSDPRPSGGLDTTADRDAAMRPGSTNVTGATISPDTDADATRVLLGRALLLSGSAERARDVLEPLLPHEDSHSSTTSPRASANVPHAEPVPAAPDAPGLSASNEAVLLYARCERILGRIDSARRLLAGAVERLDPGESGSVQLELAILESQDNRDGEAEVRIRALFASGAVRDPAIRAAACTLRSMGQLNSLDLSAARDEYRIAEREFAQLNDTQLLDGVHAVAALGWMAYFLDDQRTGLTHIERAITVSHRHGRSFVLPELHTVHAYSLAKIGRYDDALAAAEDALETARLYGYPGIAPLAGAAKLRILQDTAPAAEVLRWWRTLDALPRPAMRWWRATVDAALAEIAARLPHPARPQPTGTTPAALPATRASLPTDTTSAMLPTAAESATQPTDIRSATHPTDSETATLPIDAMSSDLPTGATPTTRAGVTTSLSTPSATGPVTDTSIPPEPADAQSREHPMRAAELAVGALACLAHGDLETAGALVERAHEVAERLDLPGQRATAARARAGYLCARGDLEAAAQAAEAAIAHYGQAGMPVFRAQALLVAAEIDGKRGDFATATARIAAAREEFAAAGAHELLTAATTAQRKLAGHRSVSGATMLSEREREVAELAARGLTNKDIAEKLFLSPRTVEDHLGRILRKLGLTGRGGIAHKLAELDRPD
ncbi:helix-turn-helix transcriptional regulator [Nocardia tengchongensis]